jgi:hypothetical protein
MRNEGEIWRYYYDMLPVWEMFLIVFALLQIRKVGSICCVPTAKSIHPCWISQILQYRVKGLWIANHSSFQFQIQHSSNFIYSSPVVWHRLEDETSCSINVLLCGIEIDCYSIFGPNSWSCVILKCLDYCGNLTRMTFAPVSQLRWIEAAAFLNCSSLKVDLHPVISRHFGTFIFSWMQLASKYGIRKWFGSFSDWERSFLSLLVATIDLHSSGSHTDWEGLFQGMQETLTHYIQFTIKASGDIIDFIHFLFLHWYSRFIGSFECWSCPERGLGSRSLFRLQFAFV